MPVYVYRNLKSGETFELEQRITEPALTADPRTGDPVRRVIQPVGIAFKGSGFYVNDSRGSRNPGPATDSAAKPADTKPADSKPADSKPAAGSAAD